LTVDISSSAVKVVAFFLEELEGSPPKIKIIGVGKEPLLPNAVRGGVIVDRDCVEEALDQAIGRALEYSEEDIDQVIFGVIGDLSYEFMTTARLIRARGHAQTTPSPYPEAGAPNITQEEIDAVYQRVVATAHDQVGTEILNNTGSTDLDTELMTASIIHTKIDGKVISANADPTHYAGREVELAIFTSFCPTYHVETLKKIAKRLRLKIIAIGSEMYTLTRSINKAKETGLMTGIDATVISMESDTTTVGVVFGGGVVASKNLHIGNDHFIAEISYKMGLTPSEARKMKDSYCAGKLAPSEATVVNNCISDTVELWLSGLEVVFEEFTGVKTFAPTIYLTGEGAKIPDVAQALKENPWTRSIAFKAPPEVTVISFKDFGHIYDLTGKISDLEYMMPAALSDVYLEMTE